MLYLHEGPRACPARRGGGRGLAGGGHQGHVVQTEPRSGDQGTPPGSK